MKFSIALACLAVEALAYQPVVRDLKAITGVLDNVKSDLQNLDAVVKKDGNGKDPEPLLKASNALLQTLKKGKTTVDGSSELALTDAVALTQPVQDLTKLGQTLTDDLKSIRPNVEKLGECQVVRTQISSINAGSQALIKSVVGKVPEEARDIANQLSAGLTKVLEQAQDDFSEQNCKGSGGGGSPSSGSGGSPSSAPGGGSSSPPEVTTTAAPGTTSAPGGGVTSAPSTGVTVAPTGTAGTPPVVTAGAAEYAPAGALAFAIAALVL
ncbi:cell wall protein [Pochonia chlamydosporia 170]|uniref:Cell wall protein n=1 Tax=Pochonia chlamydosporia 170 TaxID=1380566 RepID=A0A179F729_METCM|nr:cell wall protein [Pochonia chlamydosporia 170]OAQ61276.1 cell wall protein [Pochonia chlamydosporia 170]